MQCKMFSSKRFHNFLGPLNEAKSWVWCTLVDTILILSDQWTLLFVCLFHSPYRSGYFIYHSFHLFFGFWTLTKFYIASFWPKPFWILSLKFCARRNEDCVDHCSHHMNESPLLRSAIFSFPVLILRLLKWFKFGLPVSRDHVQDYLLKARYLLILVLLLTRDRLFKLILKWGFEQSSSWEIIRSSH